MEATLTPVAGSGQAIMPGPSPFLPRSSKGRLRRPHPPAAPAVWRFVAPPVAFACALALVAGAGAQGGAPSPIVPLPVAPAPVDTGLARPGAPATFGRGDSLAAPGADSLGVDSLARVSPDSARFDSLAYDSARGGWRVIVPREDSLRAAAIPVDRSAWITWTPRVSKLAL